MAQLSLFFLGPFVVQLGDQSIPQFASDKVRALLAYLAVEAGQPHRRSALVGLLWPDYPEHAARASLRNALANLRQVIQDHKATPPFLLIDRETIQFHSSSDHWLDVRALERYLTLDDQPSSDVSLQSEIENIKSAIDLYRGDYLQGFSLSDSPAFDEWVLLKRENLNRKVVHACSRLAGEFEAREDFEQACAYAYQLVTIKPWHEEAHRQLMRLLALSGQRAVALAQYDVCCRSLKQELDVEPDSETVRLYDQIRDGEIKGPAKIKPILHNLPAMLSRFIGREAELSELNNRLKDSDCRLLTLVGPGGCGKTRLAIEAAHQQIGHFKHGVYLVPLAGIQRHQEIPQALGQALSYSFRSEKEPWGQLLDYLGGKQVLLVMDNAEHLLEGVDMLVKLLNEASRVQILVTSRIRLNILEEKIFPLGGMAYPEESATETPTADIQAYASVQLFLDGARRVNPGYKPSEGDLKQIGIICQLVDGMPLALLLSASWSGLLGPTEIASRTRQYSLDFLETEWQDVPERHRSLRHVFDHSWDLLTKEQQDIFTGLSVFPGSYSLQAAQRVTGLGLKALRSLVDRSMVETSSKERFELHPLMHQYAREKLNGLPKQKKLFREKHCTFFVEKITWWESEMQGPGQVEAQREIAHEIVNIRLAWDWALEHAKVECLSGALDGLGGMYERLCLYRDGALIFENSVEKIQNELERQPNQNYIPLLAKMFGWQSLFNQLLGNQEKTRRAVEAGLDLLESRSLHSKAFCAERAFLLSQKGMLNYLSDRDQAQKDFEESLEIYRQEGDRWREAQILSKLSKIIFDQGDYQKSKALLEESLEIFDALGDTIGIANMLIDLCQTKNDLGEFERIDPFVHEHASKLRDLGSPGLLSDYLMVDGINFFYLGKYVEAGKLMEEALGIYEDLGDQIRCMAVGLLLGWLDVSQGFYDQGFERYQPSLDLARQVGDQHGIAMGLLGLGELYLARKAYEQARKIFLESLSYYRQTIQQSEIGLTLAGLADTEYHLGLFQDANTNFFEALQIAYHTGSWQTCLFVVGRGALFATMQGKIEKGVELYALATRYPYLGNSVFWEDTAGKFIKERAAELPKEVVAKAKERGRKRDLNETVKELLEEYTFINQGGCSDQQDNLTTH